jgi:outer membrane protein TolC
LWRNAAAKELKAAEELLSAKSDAGFYGERYKMRASLLDAEMTYWKLSFAREVVRIQQDNLGRAKKIQDWTTSRVTRQLADRADLMQAEATTGLRTLDLQSARDDERIAARAFNSLRGVDSDAVPESLAEYRVELAWRTGLPARAAQRDDVAAARAAVKAAVAGADATEQKYKPSLDVFGSYSLNSKNADRNDAMGDSFKSEHPTINVGVSFSMPIGPSAIRRTTEGYRLDAMAAQQTADRKAFEQDQEWRTLSVKLDDAKRRLQLAATVETLQKTKLENERDRHVRGRSTLYQVLMFEQEYEASRLGKLGRLTEVLALAAQLKMFAPRAN